MSIQSQENLNHEADGYTFFDIDGTLIREDTGMEMFIQAGRTQEDFETTMEERHVPGKNEPSLGRGNELALTLQDMDPQEVENMRQSAQQIEVSYRKGVEALVEGLHKEGKSTVASSAGWSEPIEAVTNGFFDKKVYAELESDGEAEDFRLNGRYQKPERMQQHLVDQGVDPVSGEGHINFIGDSKTDSEAIRYADATGGLGVLVTDSIEEPKEVDATVYFEDPEGEHDLASAVLFYHETGDLERTREFVYENELDVFRGDYDTGRLAKKHGRENEIEEMVEKVIEYV